MRYPVFVSGLVALALAPLAGAQESAPAATPATPAVRAQPASPDASGQRSDWRSRRGEGQAQRGQGFGIEGMMQRLDTNGDGVVNVSELGDNPRAQRWAEADANSDGILASGEVDAVRQSWQAQRGERRGEGRRGPGTQADPATPEI